MVRNLVYLFLLIQSAECSFACTLSAPVAGLASVRLVSGRVTLRWGQLGDDPTAATLLGGINLGATGCLSAVQTSVDGSWVQTVFSGPTTGSIYTVQFRFQTNPARVSRETILRVGSQAVLLHQPSCEEDGTGAAQGCAPFFGGPQGFSAPPGGTLSQRLTSFGIRPLTWASPNLPEWLSIQPGVNDSEIRLVGTAPSSLTRTSFQMTITDAGGRQTTPTLTVSPQQSTVSFKICDVKDITRCSSSGSDPAFSVIPTIQVGPGVSSVGLNCAKEDKPQKIDFVAFCKRSDNATVANCSVTLALASEPRSGGHDHHDENRPKGELSATTGTTGSDGFRFTYTVPQTSGLVTMTATGKTSDGADIPSATAKIRVAFPGFIQLAADPSFVLTGSKPIHVQNQWGQPDFIAVLREVAAEWDWFRAANSDVPLLTLNDISLINGGLFDINADWRTSHCGHRKGNSIDLSHTLIPIKFRNILRGLLEEYWIEIKEHTAAPAHWHLTLR